MSRYIVILFAGFFLLLQEPLAHAQKGLADSVDIGFNVGARGQFIDTIKSQCNLRIIYSGYIKPLEIDTVPNGVYTVERLLDSLLLQFDVRYIERNDKIIISPREKVEKLQERAVVEGAITTKRGKAVPFATVYLKNSSLGTISNSSGKFRLLVSDDKFTDTLVVSSMGFKQVEIPPEIFLTSDDSAGLQVEMLPAYFQIRDVIVRPSDPNLLVRQSYQERKNNYSQQPNLLSVFFRESSKQNEEYISLTEALIEVNKSSYNKKNEDLIRLIKGRNGTNTDQSELVNLVVEGGLYNGLHLDVAKYLPSFYNENSAEYCEYQLLKTISHNQRQTYVIGFKMIESPDHVEYDGKLYIDAETLGLVRAEFELSQTGIEYARSVLIRKTPRGYRAKPKYARYEVEYRHYNNIWNLQYARSELGIKVRKARGRKNKGFTCDFTATSEFVVTDQSSELQKRISFREISGPNDVLVKQVQETPSTFWVEENIIQPEEPLLSTIRKLQQEGVIPKEESVISKE